MSNRPHHIIFSTKFVFHFLSRSGLRHFNRFLSASLRCDKMTFQRSVLLSVSHIMQFITPIEKVMAQDQRIVVSLYNNPNFCSPTSLVVWLLPTFSDSDWTNEEAVVKPLLSSDVSPPKFDNVYYSSAAMAGSKQFDSPSSPPPIFLLCQVEHGLLSLFNLIWRDNQMQYCYLWGWIPQEDRVGWGGGG